MTRRAPQTYAGVTLEPGRIDALGRLRTHLADLIESGATVPCCSTTAPLWISDDNGDQAVAAGACATCPALARCRAYITEWPETGGVWAGLTEIERRETQ